MSYPAVLAIHLVAVMLFGSGLLLTSVLAAGAARHDVALDTAELRRLRRLNLLVTTPALVVLWAAGLTLARLGGWWGAGWLHAKLACVVLLTAGYVLRAPRLGQVPRGRIDRALARWFPVAAIVLAAAIIVLVTRKPG